MINGSFIMMNNLFHHVFFKRTDQLVGGRPIPNMLVNQPAIKILEKKGHVSLQQPVMLVTWLMLEKIGVYVTMIYNGLVNV